MWSKTNLTQTLTPLCLPVSLSVPVSLWQTLTVLVKNGVEVQPCPVKVLDTDTITQVPVCLCLCVCLFLTCLPVCLFLTCLSICLQVKDKILDQVYRGAPFSQRPAADSLDLGKHKPVTPVTPLSYIIPVSMDFVSF